MPEDLKGYDDWKLQTPPYLEDAEENPDGDEYDEGYRSDLEFDRKRDQEMEDLYDGDCHRW